MGVKLMGVRTIAAGTAAVLLLMTGAGAAGAASPSPSAGTGGSGPAEAGTSFRTAGEIEAAGRGSADASTGDYLYWSFAADAGQQPTVRATVRVPETAAGRSSSAWQLDVYDGLRRRQACRYGVTTRAATAGEREVELVCALRTVRAWTEPWAVDPLPGTYYVRLTAVGLAKADQGLPVHAEVAVAAEDVGGAAAVDGSLAEPLVPGIAAAKSGDEADSKAGRTVAKLFSGEPEDGWSSGWWTDRWLWTAAGGLLAALAGVWGYRLTRGTGRPSHLPPGT
ncbi:hypothetical protein LG634_12145 [Streptomyces bambusae]|uniref:hypothetical protein n=1 Tax=Streptomyces bambusae TaxID=1550616 RepID=UPI001CFDC06A|nr:hypothetical protein [Streptomyces bambusae]MCB5165582.1 hypothetical protein [Streptomyces bambusae]